LSDISLITVFVFLALTLAIEAAYWVVWRSHRVNRSIGRRLALSRRAASTHEAFSTLREERGLGAFHNSLLRRGNTLLAQTGLRIDRRLLALCALALIAPLFGALGLGFGYGTLAFVVAVFFAVALITLFFKIVRQKRIARFGELLPDSIDVLVRGLRVGYPLPAALGLVAREMPDPIGIEFGLTCDEISFGQDLRTAIDNLYRRVGQDDLLFLIMAINVQNQTGGNLAEILTGLARLLRNRAKIHLKIRALSADGRMSAVVLSVIPFLLFGLIFLISPAYFAEVRDHPVVIPALIYAAVSLALGNLVMYRMVNFKF
jgi:tight adherence protein B